MNKSTTLERNKLILTVLISALGYFVEVYDIILFAVLRVPSLKALGLVVAMISILTLEETFKRDLNFVEPN